MRAWDMVKEMGVVERGRRLKVRGRRGKLVRGSLRARHGPEKLTVSQDYTDSAGDGRSELGSAYW